MVDLLIPGWARKMTRRVDAQLSCVASYQFTIPARHLMLPDTPGYGSRTRSNNAAHQWSPALGKDAW